MKQVLAYHTRAYASMCFGDRIAFLIYFSHTRDVTRAYAQGLRISHTRSIRDLDKTCNFKIIEVDVDVGINIDVDRPHVHVHLHVHVHVHVHAHAHAHAHAHPHAHLHAHAHVVSVHVHVYVHGVHMYVDSIPWNMCKHM